MNATMPTPRASSGESIPAGMDASWKLWGSCTPEKIHLFFPPEPGETDIDPANHIALGKETAARYEQARAICGDCAVQPECLAYAMTVPEKFGMWGGMTPEERNKMRKDANRKRSAERVKQRKTLSA